MCVGSKHKRNQQPYDIEFSENMCLPNDYWLGEFLFQFGLFAHKVIIGMHLWACERLFWLLKIINTKTLRWNQIVFVMIMGTQNLHFHFQTRKIIIKEVFLFCCQKEYFMKPPNCVKGLSQPLKANTLVGSFLICS